MTLYFININGELYKDDYAITPEMIEALARQGWNRIGRAKWRQLKRLERISKGISKALVKDEHDLRRE